jgi:hypothetical protein
MHLEVSLMLNFIKHNLTFITPIIWVIVEE